MNLTVRPGWLRLTGQESMNSLHHVTLVARRQQEHEMQAETRMDFAPVCPEQMAGFTYCYDSMNFYLLGKTCAEDGTPVLELLKSDTGVVEDVCDPVPAAGGVAVHRPGLPHRYFDGRALPRFYRGACGCVCPRYGRAA